MAGAFTMLMFGSIAAVLYVLTDLAASLLLPGYSFRDQTVSELSAIGASTRPFWIFMSIVTQPFIIAFGIGVWKAAGTKLQKLTGFMLSLWGVTGYLWLLVPMNQRGALGSETDTLHLVMAGFTVALLVILIAVGSGAGGKRFRIYSFTTLVLMMAAGWWTSTLVDEVALSQPTPWIGITERVSVYGPIVWMFVLSRMLVAKYSRKS